MSLVPRILAAVLAASSLAVIPPLAAETAPPPGAAWSKAKTSFQPVSPLDGAQTFSPMPSLRWEAGPEARDYAVQIARDSGFADVVVGDRTPIRRFVPAQGLKPGRYFWRVAAVSASGTGGFSAPVSFTISAPAREFAVPANCDAAEIQAIMDSAARQTPSRVVFAAGAVYRVDPAGALISLKDVAELEIDGNGAKIIITNGNAGLAHLSNCHRVTLKNFTVDMNPAPFSVGRVTAVSRAAGTFTVVAEAGMPEIDSPLFLEYWTWGVILDNQVPGKMKAGSPLLLATRKDKLVRSGEGLTLTLSTPATGKFLEVGDKWVQFTRKDNVTMPLVRGEQCRELVLDHITSYAVSSFHYALFSCDDAKVIGCRALVAAGRWFGGNADGVHLRFTSIGPWIEDCTFEGLGDDGVAIYAKGVVIQEKPADNQLILDGTFFSLRAGSKFLVFDPRAGRAVTENRTVTDVKRLPPAKTGDPERWLVEFEPAFAEPVGSGFDQVWKNDQIFDRTLLNHEFMVRRNVFKEIRRYGVILRGVAGAIEENKFINTSDSAITMQNEPHFWRNGLGSDRVLIQRNMIDGCNFTQTSADRGAIHVVLRMLGEKNGTWSSVSAPWRGHRDIIVRANRITGWQQQAIHFESVEGGEIVGNTISENRPALTSSSGQTAIFVRNVSGVTIGENRIESLQPETRAVSVEDSVEVKGVIQ